jgi:hypothetical protein
MKGTDGESKRFEAVRYKFAPDAVRSYDERCLAGDALRMRMIRGLYVKLLRISAETRSAEESKTFGRPVPAAPMFRDEVWDREHVHESKSALATSSYRLGARRFGRGSGPRRRPRRERLPDTQSGRAWKTQRPHDADTSLPFNMTSRVRRCPRTLRGRARSRLLCRRDLNSSSYYIDGIHHHITSTFSPP